MTLPAALELIERARTDEHAFISVADLTEAVSLVSTARELWHEPVPLVEVD